MTLPEKFALLCEQDDGPLAKPFSVDGHAVACDRSAFIILHGKGGADDQPSRSIRRSFVAWAAMTPPTDAIKTTVGRVLAWTGPPTWLWPCIYCDGTGNVVGTDGEDCEDCDGSGARKYMTGDEAIPGTIAGLVVSRVLIARFLSVVKGSCLMWAHGDELRIRGNAWTVVVLRTCTVAQGTEFRP